MADPEGLARTDGSIARMVFCDFDGTITLNETFVGMLERFAPEAWAELKADIYSLRLSLREGCKQLMNTIPSSRYGEILDYVRHQPIQAGWPEFLEFLHHQQVPLVVVSGGLRGMVETVLAPWRGYLKGIHAAEVDDRGEFLRVYSEFEGETELVAKGQVLQHYGPREAVAIGDSVTDLNLALQASLVFAREPLSQYLRERQCGFIPWSTFFDVREYLIQYWG